MPSHHAAPPDPDPARQSVAPPGWSGASPRSLGASSQRLAQPSPAGPRLPCSRAGNCTVCTPTARRVSRTSHRRLTRPPRLSTRPPAIECHLPPPPTPAPPSRQRDRTESRGSLTAAAPSPANPPRHPAVPPATPLSPLLSSAGARLRLRHGRGGHDAMCRHGRSRGR